MILRLSLAVALATGTRATASSLGGERPIAPAPRFLLPNEPNPADARVIVSAAGRGAYVAVGSERALFTFLMAADDRVSSLWAIDRDLGIVEFHRINRALVRVVPDGDVEQYRDLRRRADPARWRERAGWALLRGRIGLEQFMSLRDARVPAWWRAQLYKFGPHPLDTPPADAAAPFAGVNYLHDEALFRRVQNLAASGRYRVAAVDLARGRAARNWLDAGLDPGERLALLDLSNAWQDHYPNEYLGRTNCAHLLEDLDEFTARDAVVMISVPRLPHVPCWFRGYRLREFRRALDEPTAWTGGTRTWYDNVDRFDRDARAIRAEFEAGRVPPYGLAP